MFLILTSNSALISYTDLTSTTYYNFLFCIISNIYFFNGFNSEYKTSNSCFNVFDSYVKIFILSSVLLIYVLISISGLN